MLYAMLICGDEANWFDTDPSVIREAMDEIYAWMERWQKEGKIADGGAELDTVRKAKTVRRGADGQPTVTDGPYLELKEVIGGFIMLRADTIDEAVAVAATWPGVTRFGDAVEVRPVIQR
ncbi:MAG: YciI family protein [Micromonosporaceae bacterium]|jgi:hypothetical protein